MCLGIPGRIIDTYLEHEVLMGKVDFSGVANKVCLAYVPEVEVGDYVIVHVGFALSVVDEDEARRIFTFLEGMNEGHELQQEEPEDEIPG